MDNKNFDKLLYLHFIEEFNNPEYIKLNKHTKVVSAFPGCGKTYFYNNNKNLKVLDSDSSTFDKSDFPQNYIKHIKENIGKVDIIFVSSHKEVRESLAAENIAYFLIYPIDTDEIKEVFMQRYKDRGSPLVFINFINSRWSQFIKELRKDKGSRYHRQLTGDR